MSESALLAATGITKRFGGVQALSEVSFTINHGEIYGLIGPNGAGKTSLFNVLTGIYVPDGGTFTFDGEPLEHMKPNDVAARGIARTYQNNRHLTTLSGLGHGRTGRPRPPPAPASANASPTTSPAGSHAAAARSASARPSTASAAT